MLLTFAEQLSIIMKRQNITKIKLAELLGTTNQNINNKFKRNNFTENDMKEICNILGLKYTLTIEE